MHLVNAIIFDNIGLASQICSDNSRVIDNQWMEMMKLPFIIL